MCQAYGMALSLASLWHYHLHAVKRQKLHGAVALVSSVVKTQTGHLWTSSSTIPNSIPSLSLGFLWPFWYCPRYPNWVSWTQGDFTETGKMGWLGRSFSPTVAKQGASLFSCQSLVTHFVVPQQWGHVRSLGKAVRGHMVKSWTHVCMPPQMVFMFSAPTVNIYSHRFCSAHCSSTVSGTRQWMPLDRREDWRVQGQAPWLEAIWQSELEGKAT